MQRKSKKRLQNIENDIFDNLKIRSIEIASKMLRKDFLETTVIKLTPDIAYPPHSPIL